MKLLKPVPLGTLKPGAIFTLTPGGVCFELLAELSREGNPMARILGDRSRQSLTKNFPVYPQKSPNDKKRTKKKMARYIQLSLFN